MANLFSQAIQHKQAVIEQAANSIPKESGEPTVESPILLPFIQPGRWRFPDLKDQVKKVSINKHLQDIMRIDPDVYNWVWCSVNIAMQLKDHTIEVPAPEHVRAYFPDEKIYVVKLDDNVVSVMI